jgi:curved DNA-binding protein CbpA
MYKFEDSKNEKLVDYFHILGVNEFASSEDIREMYKKLALTFHPDKNHNKYAIEHMKDINEAKEVLLNETLKIRYMQYYNGFYKNKKINEQSFNSSQSHYKEQDLNNKNTTIHTVSDEDLTSTVQKYHYSEYYIHYIDQYLHFLNEKYHTLTSDVKTETFNKIKHIILLKDELMNLNNQHLKDFDKVILKETFTMLKEISTFFNTNPNNVLAVRDVNKLLEEIATYLPHEKKSLNKNNSKKE